VFGDGSNGRDFTYVTEVARGIALAGLSGPLDGSRVNIAYGRMVTIGEIAALIMQACGRNHSKLEFAAPRPGDVHVLRADTARAREVLGFQAEISIHDGLDRYLAWFRSRHSDPSVLLESETQNWRMPLRGGA
jgi:UDP-glucose 4-epimerase